MRVGIIGAGQVGSTLGSGLVRAGHEVIYGSRDDGRTAPHPGAILGSVRGAVIDGEVIILATPWDAVPDALGAAGDFGGKILIDATNPITPSFTLAHARTESGGERVAQLAKNARVVKCFNTTGFDIMASPRFGAARAVMFLAGDDPNATATAAKLAADLDFDAVPLAGLARARDLEPLAMLWIALARTGGLGRNIAFGLARRAESDPASGATAMVSALRPTAAKRAITIIGTGNIGRALAEAWSAAGHDVTIGVRDATKAEVKDLVSFGIEPAPVDGSAKDADVIVLATPHAAVDDVLARIGDVRGKIVVDCTNGIGPGLTVAAPANSSGSETIAARAPGSRVVRAFNQQGAETLRDARFGDLRAVSFVAGDDADARAAVGALSADVGLDTVDAGPLEAARSLDHLTMIWLSASKALGSRDIGLTLLRRS